MRVPLLITLAVLALALWASEAHPAPRDGRLAGVETFAFALGAEADTDAELARLAPYDLVVLDGELTGREQVERLRAGGSIVLGYLSVGTIEPSRSWYPRLRRFRLRDRFEQFGEPYARASDPGFRRAIAGRIAPRLLARGGFDGLFLDNTDMVEGHPGQRRGMRRLVRRLARLVHGRTSATGPGLLFAQNGERSIGPLLAVLDGWNREDVTWTYSFKRRRYVRRPAAQTASAQAALARISAAGLLVTATDYTAAGDAAAEGESVANACAAVAIPFVSNIALSRLPAAPLRCPA